MYLFFDTETTGLWNFKEDPMSPSQPDTVQLAALLCDDGGTVFAAFSFLVEPTHFKSIPEQATKVHGITFAACEEYGTPALDILETIQTWAKEFTPTVVCHNYDFDSKLLNRLCLQSEYPNHLVACDKVCTMRSSTEFCKIPHQTRDSYKWPTLQELHMKLFQKGFAGAHDALADVLATKRCFFELLRKGVIPV